MTGGSLNKNTGVLSRANEVKRLGSELEEITSRLKGQKAQTEKIKEERDLLALRIQDCEADMQEAERAAGLLYERQAAHREGIEAVCGRIQSLTLEQTDIKRKTGAGKPD